MYIFANRFASWAKQLKMKFSFTIWLFGLWHILIIQILILPLFLVFHQYIKKGQLLISWTNDYRSQWEIRTWLQFAVFLGAKWVSNSNEGPWVGAVLETFCKLGPLSPWILHFWQLKKDNLTKAVIVKTNDNSKGVELYVGVEVFPQIFKMYFWDVYDINLWEKIFGRSMAYSCRTNAFI